MEILITHIYNTSEDIAVDFSTAFGDGKALWNGNKNRKPEKGKKYRVEYEVTDELEWGKDARLSKEKRFGIFTKSERVYIVGILEKVLGGGVFDFRFGDSILQLEIEGRSLPKGQYVEINADSLEVYDLGD